MTLNAAMIEALQAEYAKIESIDPSMPAYGKLTALLDKADRNTLLQLSLADIKFVSKLAANRVRTRRYPTPGKRYPLFRS
jgi:hypothetical protein